MKTGDRGIGERGESIRRYEQRSGRAAQYDDIFCFCIIPSSNGERLSISHTYIICIVTILHTAPQQFIIWQFDDIFIWMESILLINHTPFIIRCCGHKIVREIIIIIKPFCTFIYEYHTLLLFVVYYIYNVCILFTGNLYGTLIIFLLSCTHYLLLWDAV